MQFLAVHISREGSVYFVRKRVQIDRLLENLIPITRKEPRATVPYNLAGGMICISFPRGSHSSWAAINDYNDRSKFNDDLMARATIY